MDLLNDSNCKAVQQAQIVLHEGQIANHNEPIEGTLFIDAERQKNGRTALGDNRREKILLADILYVIRSKMIFVLIMSLLLAGAGFCYARLTYIPRYFATSSLVVQANYSTNETTGITPVEANFAVSLVPTYTQILKSNRVMDYVIEGLGLDIPVEELRSYIGLKSIEDTAILHLTVTCPDPQLAIDISNSIAEVAPKAFQETITIGTVRILDAAFISGVVGDKAILIALGAGLLGIFSAIAFQLLLYVVFPKVCNSADIESAIGLPVLGEIEHIKRGKRRKGLLLYEGGATNKFIESYMTLDIVISHMTEKMGIKKILITSAKENEGKTSVVANLGIALARGGKRVLLIDCDLRKPDLHKRFGIDKDSTAELYGYETRSDRAKSIAKVFPGLHVLPFINDIDKRHMLFRTSGFSKAISDFASEYDIIIFDSAPVYDVAESLGLVGLSDAVIMVIKQNDVLIKEHVKSAEKLSTLGGKFIGAIFNDVRFIIKKSRYLNKYSYNNYPYNRRTGQLPG